MKIITPEELPAEIGNCVREREQLRAKLDVAVEALEDYDRKDHDTNAVAYDEDSVAAKVLAKIKQVNR